MSRLVSATVELAYADREWKIEVDLVTARNMAQPGAPLLSLKILSVCPTCDWRADMRGPMGRRFVRGLAEAARRALVLGFDFVTDPSYAGSLDVEPDVRPAGGNHD